MKPKILIVPENGIAKNIYHYIVNLDYGNAVSKAGGLPFAAINPKLISEYANICDGLLLTDGPFIHRRRYGEIYYDSNLPELDSKKEIIELELTKLMIKNNRPILGIRRGMNLLNAYFGGTLTTENGVESIKELAKDLIPIKVDENGNVIAFKHKTLNVYGSTCSPNEIDQELVDTFIKGALLWKNL